ncbi:hypothetical protein PSPO01_07216 [Paraphaeosphaeria sporulosa]
MAFHREGIYACSRMFAPDKGVQVDRRYRIPFDVVAVTSVIACLLTFVNIGNPTAFNGVVSLTIASLSGLYLLACGCLPWRRLQGRIGESKGTSTHGSIANTIGRKLVCGPWKLPECLELPITP